MFFETGKKFLELFSEIKNKRICGVCYTEVMIFCFRSILQIWIILIGFRDTNDFVNIGICKHEFKFNCRGYCRFTLISSNKTDRPTIENLQRLPRATLFQPDLACFRDEQWANSVFVSDFPHFVRGFRAVYGL